MGVDFLYKETGSQPWEAWARIVINTIKGGLHVEALVFEVDFVVEFVDEVVEDPRFDIA